MVEQQSQCRDTARGPDLFNLNQKFGSGAFTPYRGLRDRNALQGANRVRPAPRGRKVFF